MSTKKSCRDCANFDRECTTTFVVCPAKARSDRAQAAHESLTTASSTPCDQFSPGCAEAWGLFE